MTVMEQIAGGLLHLTHKLDQFPWIHWIGDLKFKSNSCHGNHRYYHGR